MDVTFDLAAVLGAGAALVVILGGIYAGYARLRRWIQDVAHSSRQTADQLQTSNGTTVAGYVEATAEKIEQMQGAIGALTEQTATNRDLATSAHTLAEAVSHRLDKHLLGHN